MKANRTQRLERLTEAAMQKTPFVRSLTMAEVEDCVDALRLVREVLKGKMEDIRSHVQECDDRKCRSGAKDTYRFLRRRRKRVVACVNDLGLQLAGQRERMEFTIAARLERTTDAGEE
jgi:hypothetical protein